MTDGGDGYKRVADALHEAEVAAGRVDYNVLTDDEVHELLVAKRTLSRLCLRYRENQHTQERDHSGG